MARSYKPIDLSRLKTYGADKRAHKATVTRAAARPPPGASAVAPLAGSPDHLGAPALRHVVAAGAVAGTGQLVSERPAADGGGASLKSLRGRFDHGVPGELFQS